MINKSWLVYLVTQVLTLNQLNEKQQFYLYVAVTDNKTCPHCNKYHLSWMTRREIYARFPDLQKPREDFWLPRVHMTLWNRDNCRCGLLLDETSAESVLQNLLTQSLEGYSPTQLRMHALALSSIREVRKILEKERRRSEWFA